MATVDGHVRRSTHGLADDLDAAVEANVEAWLVGPGRDPADVEPAAVDLVRTMQQRAFEVTARWDDLDEVELEPPAPAALLRAGLLTETAVHVMLALTRDPWVAGTTMVAFGLHAAIWGSVVATIRQRLVPDRLLGRVTSVYQLLTMGGAAIGALAGGWLARPFGLTGPFWPAAAVNAALIVVAWPKLTPTTIYGERPDRQDQTGEAVQP